MSDPSPAGLYKGLHLCVNDIEAARDELVARGIEVSEPFYFGEDGQTSGVHPGRSDYGTFCEIADPDGNVWLLQEVKRNVG